MKETSDLKTIKKYFGEEMMHFCRSRFCTILDKYPGKLQEVMLSNFASNKFLYEDIVANKLEVNFVNYICSFFKEDAEKVDILESNLSPVELMKKVGYTLYECQKEEDIQQFKKYYAPNEELCTFNGGRLNWCYVFFAVKDNASSLRRKDFKNPKREDEYGTSVISIQFTKDSSHMLSIKNRYNHTVSNPDDTFSNNLENIVEGLTKSFEKTYGLIQKIKNNDFEIPGYVRASDGKFYKYNYEINNVYYCPNNIIISNFIVKKYPKEKYLIFDYFILDLVNKRIYCDFQDSFVENLESIKDIRIIKENNQKKVIITPFVGNKIIIILDKANNIIEYSNPNLKTISDYFLSYNKYLYRLELPSIEEIGNSFLCSNKNIEVLDMPKLRKIGNLFLSNNLNLVSINMPNLEKVGNEFLASYGLYINEKFNKNLKKICFPKLQKVGSNFLLNYSSIEEIFLPNLIEIKDNFLQSNNALKELYLPKIKKAGNGFLTHNQVLIKLYAPKLELVGSNFLDNNLVLSIMETPNIKIVSDYFLSSNKCLQELILSNLEETGSYFLTNNDTINTLYFPKLKKVGYNFLKNCNSLKILYVPTLKKAGGQFLDNCYNLKEITIPNIYLIRNKLIVKKLILINYKKRLLAFIFKKNNKNYPILKIK